MLVDNVSVDSGFSVRFASFGLMFCSLFSRVSRSYRLLIFSAIVSGVFSLIVATFVSSVGLVVVLVGVLFRVLFGPLFIVLVLVGVLTGILVESLAGILLIIGQSSDLL